MRRWLVLPLLAAVVLAAAAPASGHVRTGRNLVPRHGALFGAFVNSSGDAWANVVGLQRTLGYRLTIVHHYRPWAITSYRIDKSALAHRQIPMISWSPGGTTTAAEITSGSQDALITRTARDIKALHKKIFVRLAYEMDQPRGHPRYIGTPSEFVPAWRHVVRIFHRVGAKNARFVWCAIAANFKTGHAQAYYPGDGYVDVVGDDLYDIGGKAEWPAAERLYRAHPSKPFAFPEWGLWGIDGPQFVQRMASFVKSHPRTRLIAYFNAKPGSIFDLASKPRSLAAYKRYIVPLA